MSDQTITLVYRGSGSDLATDIFERLPPDELRRFMAKLAKLTAPLAIAEGRHVEPLPRRYVEPERCHGNCSRGGDGPSCGLPGCRGILADCPMAQCPNKEALPHPCPYKIDVNDDSRTLCNCCAVCEENCRADI